MPDRPNLSGNLRRFPADAQKAAAAATAAREKRERAAHEAHTRKAAALADRANAGSVACSASGTMPPSSS